MTIASSTQTQPTIYARMFDGNNVNWTDPRYNEMFLKVQESWANERLQARGHVFLNDVYDMLGLPRTSAGQLVGWLQEHAPVEFLLTPNNDGSIMIDFNVGGVMYHKI